MSGQPKAAEKKATYNNGSAKFESEGRKRQGGWIFRYSRLDAILVAISVSHVAAMLAVMFWSDRIDAPLLIAAGLGFVFLCCTNYQCVAHNFIHNPFFSREPLNHVFSILNSLSLGMPQTLYRFHHLNHHKYNSDYQDPETGETRDYSSIYRFSRSSGQAEGVWTYSLLGPFRVDLGQLFAIAKQRGLGWLVILETLALLGFYAALAWMNWQVFLAFLVPVLFAGQAAAFAQNYLEHKGADPGSRLTDSVSCYSPLYNFLWFNNGYHQEHHYRPYVHWTQIRKIKSKMLPESERRVVRGSHLANLL
jgi:fatty acid desaturase